jgi:hypothetical protein
LTDELGDEAFRGLMEVQRATFETSAAGREPISRNDLRDGISTSAASLSKAKVIIGGDVKTTSAATGGMEVSVVVLGFPIVTDNRAARDPGNRSGEAIVNTEFEAPGIE